MVNDSMQDKVFLIVAVRLTSRDPVVASGQDVTALVQQHRTYLTS